MFLSGNDTLLGLVSRSFAMWVVQDLVLVNLWLTPRISIGSTVEVFVIL